MEGFCWDKIPWYEWDLIFFFCQCITLCAPSHICCYCRERPEWHAYWWKIRKCHPRDTTSAFSRRNRIWYQVALTFMSPFWNEALSERRSVSSLDLCCRHELSSSSTTEQTSFLCELRRFLHAILPQGRSVSPAVQLDSLQSLPPLMLGLSSSETLLAAIINSSVPTIFSFSRWASTLPVRQEQLAMSPALLEEISQRLEQSEMQIMELIREEKVAHSATEGLRRLKELIGFQRNEPVTGDKNTVS